MFFVYSCVVDFQHGFVRLFNSFPSRRVYGIIILILILILILMQ